MISASMLCSDSFLSLKSSECCITYHKKTILFAFDCNLLLIAIITSQQKKFYLLSTQQNPRNGWVKVDELKLKTETGLDLMLTRSCEKVVD